MTTNDAALLREALTVLTTYGWCQDSLNNEHGWVCAAGALAVVVDEEMPFPFEYDRHESTLSGWTYAGNRMALQTLLGRAAVDLFPERAYVSSYEAGEAPPFSPELVAFNDHPDTTFEDVVAVYEHAIRRAELVNS